MASDDELELSSSRLKPNKWPSVSEWLETAIGAAVVSDFVIAPELTKKTLSSPTTIPEGPFAVLGASGNESRPVTIRLDAARIDYDDDDDDEDDDDEESSWERRISVMEPVCVSGAALAAPPSVT